MLNPWVSFLVYWAELLIASVYFSGIFERRYAAWKCFLAGLALYSSASALNLVFGNNTTVNLLTSFLVPTFFSLCCYRGTAFQRIFYALIFALVSGALETLTVSLGASITGNALLDYNSSPALLLMEAVSSKGATLLIVLVAIRFIGHSGNGAKVPLAFLIYPLVATICLFVFWRVGSQPDASAEVQYLLAIPAGGLFLSSVLLFVTYAKQAEKDLEAVQVKGELSRLQTEQAYFQILDQQNQQLMIYAHDAKKHLAAIQALNSDPRIENYISKLSEQLKEYTRYSHSGNKLLDVMLRKYTLDCEMRKIRFEHDVKVCNLAQVEDIDLVAIVGNLMDNAVAAAEKSSEKAITFSTVHRNAYSVIIITNSCDLPPNQEGNRLISTKAENGHGFGMKIVEKTVRKYQGDLDWEYDSNKRRFTTTVMIADA